MKKPEILQGEVKEFIDEVWKHNDNPEIRPFYLQPFKPEMIEEYFEGFVEYDWLYDMQNNWDMNIRTLSQFITNCIQAGIKLTWKEQK